MKNYIDQLRDYNIRQAEPVRERAALLVIDMQRRFRVMAEQVLDNVILLINACIASDVPLFFTRQGNRRTAEAGGMLTAWWGDITEYGSWDWQFLEALPSTHHGTIIEKTRYDAFFGTGLDDQLRKLRVHDIIICGVTTNCCCETTAREAFVRDYRVFFVADATAAINEELHLASLKNLAYGFAYLLNTNDLCDKPLRKDGSADR